jgi:hypothetical protein
MTLANRRNPGLLSGIIRRTCADPPGNGGPDGAATLLSLQTDTSVLFEAFDPQFNKLFDFSIADTVEHWESR